MSTWIKVESPSELLPSMRVEIRPCGFCGRTEKLTLLQPATTESPVAINGDGDVVPSGGAWRTVPGLCVHPRRPFDPTAAIRDGRLWRLAEEPPGVEEKETRELERVR